MYKIMGKYGDEWKMLAMDSREIDALSHLADFQSQIGTPTCLFSEIKIVEGQ